MAEDAAGVCQSLPLGGYQFNFVESPPAHYECPVCLLILRDPHILSCCGKKICLSCVEPILSANKPCPLCQQEFHTMLEKEIQRAVLGLKVYCSHREEGCDWVGQLRDFDRHVSHESDGECLFVEVECQHGCGCRFTRGAKVEHERNLCLRRPLDVQIQRLREDMMAMCESLKVFYASKVEALQETIQEQQSEINSLKTEVAVLKLKGSATKRVRNPNETISFADGRTLMLKKANIADEEVDVIVNSADSKLIHHKGLPGSLNAKSNGELQRYCDIYRKENGEVEVGQIAVTQGGGRLYCKYVIHAVGPSAWCNSESSCKAVLYKVITQTLEEAEKLKATSIAIPAVGTGRYRVKPDVSAAAIVQAILEHKYTLLRDIHIVTYTDTVYDSFTRHIALAIRSQHQS